MEGFESTDNPADVLSKAFFARYKYELLASVAFIALIGGIVFGMQVLKKNESVEPVAIKKDSSFIIMVDIGGAILNPGVYEHEMGSRVQDAIDVAGGFSENVDEDWVSNILNRAEVLSDGQKIVVPFVKKEIEGEFSTSSASDGKINLNTATKGDLITLPGIGDVYATRIIENRPYRTIDDLLAVPGIGPSIVETIRDMVGVY